MAIRIEEAFNDCFERMLRGESLESCLHSYPQYAPELDMMLRTSYDVKRKAFPIQPRPEFKYWARARIQGIQAAEAINPAHSRSTSFNLRRNLAISLSAILVFVIASSGTVAASNDAMPDEPLYNVKLAVEQAQVALTPSDTGKAELYARLAEKRAQEIAVMAAEGKEDKVLATTKIMNTQLQKLEENLVKFEAETREESAAQPTPWAPTTNGAAGTRPTNDTGTTVKPDVTANATRIIDLTANNEKTLTSDTGNTQLQPTTKRAASIIKAREAINTSTTNSATILKNALDNAPDSIKPGLNSVLNQTITTNKRIQLENKRNISPINKETTDTDTDTDTDNKPTDNKTRINTNSKFNLNIKSNTSIKSGTDTGTNSNSDSGSGTNTGANTYKNVTNRSTETTILNNNKTR